MADFMELLTGLVNGARSFGDRAKWTAGGYGNAPMPAPYEGGPDYPAKNDANAYVRNNYPSDGRHAFSVTRPESFYTPLGIDAPPSGRGPTAGEMHQGSPTGDQLMPFLSLLLNQYRRGER